MGSSANPNTGFNVLNLQCLNGNIKSRDNSTIRYWVYNFEGETPELTSTFIPKGIVECFRRDDIFIAYFKDVDGIVTSQTYFVKEIDFTQGIILWFLSTTPTEYNVIKDYELIGVPKTFDRVLKVNETDTTKGFIEIVEPNVRVRYVATGEEIVTDVVYNDIDIISSDGLTFNNKNDDTLNFDIDAEENENSYKNVRVKVNYTASWNWFNPITQETESNTIITYIVYNVSYVKKELTYLIEYPNNEALVIGSTVSIPFSSITVREIGGGIIDTIDEIIVNKPVVIRKPDGRNGTGIIVDKDNENINVYISNDLAYLQEYIIMASRWKTAVQTEDDLPEITGDDLNYNWLISVLSEHKIMQYINHGTEWTNYSDAINAGLGLLNTNGVIDVIVDNGIEINGENKVSLNNDNKTIVVNNNEVSVQTNADTEQQVNYIKKNDNGLYFDLVNFTADVLEVLRNQLQTNINTVQSNLDTEVSNRENADVVLQANIDTKISKDIVLSTEAIVQDITIDVGAKSFVKTLVFPSDYHREQYTGTLPIATEQELSAEAELRTQGDEELQTNINTEQSRAELAEETLQTNIGNEQNRAEGIEQGLQTSIETEQSRAELAEQTLQTNIENEQTRAEGEEGTLQGNIELKQDIFTVENTSTTQDLVFDSNVLTLSDKE